MSLIVFDTMTEFAGIAKTLERIDKTAVVALVKSDTRLVENIKHVDKLAPELCGKPYALLLTARQRCRIAVERKIFETYVDHERNLVRISFRISCATDGEVGGRRSSTFLAIRADRDVETCQFGDILAVDKKMKSLAVKACAATLRTHGARKPLSLHLRAARPLSSS